MITLVPSPSRVNGQVNIAGVIEELRKTVSVSRLKAFQQCRLKFFFRYVLKVAKPSTSSLFVGRVVHAVLQAWSLDRWRQEGRPREFFRELFGQLWSDPEAVAGIAWKEAEEVQKESAWALIETYLQETPIPADEKPLAVEARVEMDLAQIGLPVLVGVLDLVRPGGKIVDFKTTATTPSTSQASHNNELQLTAYGLLYREATGAVESGFELHHLVKLKKPKIVVLSLPRVTPKQETRLYRSIRSYLDGLENRDFVPSPGLGCLGCEYFRECRAWPAVEERRLAA